MTRLAILICAVIVALACLGLANSAPAQCAGGSCSVGTAYRVERAYSLAPAYTYAAPQTTYGVPQAVYSTPALQVEYPTILEPVPVATYGLGVLVPQYQGYGKLGGYGKSSSKTVTRERRGGGLFARFRGGGCP